MRVLELLLEDKSEFVAQQFGDKLKAAYSDQENKKAGKAETIVKALLKADPDAGKNLVWIARMYVAKQFKMEDIPRIKSEIEKFKKVKNKLSIKDLNAYRTLDSLYDALEPLQDTDIEQSKKKQIATKKSNVEYIINEPDFKALIPRDVEAAKIYGAGTKWCTSADDDNKFESYAKRGDLVIIILKHEGKVRKFQFHYEANSFMNERDQRATHAELLMLAENPHYLPFLEKLIQKHHG